MTPPRFLSIGPHEVVVVDTLGDLDADITGKVLVTGDHGGIGPARRAIQRPPRLAIFNDSGVGKDAAGTAGLDLLAQFGIPAATVSSASARIGDAEDTLEHGVVSFVNVSADELGIGPGLGVKDAIMRLPPVEAS